MAFINYWRFRGNATYVRLNDEVSIIGTRKREELNARLNFKLTKNWYTGAGWREDLAGNRTIRQDFILGYQDECSLIELTYRRDQTQDQGLLPDNAFLIRFTLRSRVD
jgi:LPS-assembly protein